MPYWDDGSGQSKSQYDASGGMDHHGNQNTSGNENGNTGGNSSKVSTGVKVGSSAISYAKTGNPFGLIAQGANWVKQNIFTKKPSPDYGFDNKGNFTGEGLTRMEMRKPALLGGDDGGNDYGRARQTFNTQSLVTAPTADKSFGHQWDFKAYDNQQATTTPNVYDYSKAPYAKKGKLVRKYATGQEVKKRSLPPSKGPDSKGLPSILENSDYFTKLIGE